MRYRDFEFYASPKDGEIRSPNDTSTDVKKTFFCEIYHVQDEGMANQLDCFFLKEGRDIPVNFEPGLIAALQRYVDTHYDQLMATHNGQEVPQKKDYLNEFITNTDFDLLYQQKQALVEARARNLPVDPETLDGLIHFLDFIGDWAEEQGAFTYPPFEEEHSITDDLIRLAREELNDCGKVSYVAPDNSFMITITVKTGSDDCINPGKEFYWLQLLEAKQNGFVARTSGGVDYNDFEMLRELCDNALAYYARVKDAQKPGLDSQISSASSRTAPTASTPTKPQDKDRF